MKKKLFVTGLIMIIFSFVFISGIKGESGLPYKIDALYYQGKVYLATISSGAAELYEIDNTKITKVATVSAIAGDYGCQGFIDAVINIEPRGLFLFLTDGQYIYKYDVNDPANPTIFKKSKDSLNSKFIGLGKIDNKIYSVSNQGIKIWNDDMQVFYDANFNNAFSHNIKFSKQGNFVFNVNRNQLEIYEAYSQKLVSSINIEANDNHQRNIYNDATDGTIYFVDDAAVKQVDFSGKVIKSFKHTSTQGYDIAYTPGDDHLYFSDGIGIVKLNKSDLKPLSWVYTKDFSGPNGWATGLKVVRDNYGEKIFVVDNNEIIILNQDFKKVGSINIDKDNKVCFIAESLSLTLDINHALAGSEVRLSGRGYSPGENLSIYLANKKISSVYADNIGRYAKTIIIPSYNANTLEFKPGKADIKVVGDSSGRTYSTNFQIDAIIDNSGVLGLAPQVSKRHGLPGEVVVLSGLIFNPGEYLFIYFDNKKIDNVYADLSGNFSKAIVVPNVKPGKYEIKIGPQFGSGYIITFEVDDNHGGINVAPLIGRLLHGLPGEKVILNGAGFIPGDYIFIYFVVFQQHADIGERQRRDVENFFNLSDKDRQDRF